MPAKLSRTRRRLVFVLCCLSGVRAIHAPAFMARGKSRRNTFGTTSGQLASGNFDGFTCKRHWSNITTEYGACPRPNHLRNRSVILANHTAPNTFRQLSLCKDGAIRRLRESPPSGQSPEARYERSAASSHQGTGFMKRKFYPHAVPSTGKDKPK